MFKNITVSNNLSRRYLADKNMGMSYHDRLVKSNAIDLRDNHVVIDLGNGYSRIEVIDESKLVR